MRTALVLLLLTAPLVGCIGSDEPVTPTELTAVDFSHLGAPDADEIVDGDQTRTFMFHGVVAQTAVGLPLVGGAFRVWQAAFEADASVGYLELTVDFDTSAGDLHGYLADPEGRIQCGAVTIGAPKTCTTPVLETSGVQDWTVSLGPGFDNAPAGMAFDVTITLHSVTHLLAQLGDPLAGVDDTIMFRVSDTGINAAEPNVGVLSDGTVFAQEGTATMRSTDDGKTWTNVAPPGNDRVTLDPMLRVDPYTDTVYVDHLYVGCSALSMSTDAGATWLTNPAACGAPANDHQKLAVGPNPLGIPLNAVYYAYSSFVEGAWVSRSLDGGITWTTTMVTDERFRNTGPVEADRDGTVFVPYYLCDGAIGVGLSTDYGMSFAFERLYDDVITCDGTHRTDADPGPAVDAAGNLYIAYRTNESVRYIMSTDKGTTWSEPVTVSPAGLRSFTHVDAVAGDDGRIAIAYRGTADSDKGPNGDGYAAWHMYVTFVEDAGTDAAIARTGMINPVEDPVQRGPICSMGLGCSGGSRNLLDFIDIAVGPDGRVYVVYADGCDGTCPTPGDSRARDGMVGIVDSGVSLFVDRAPWA